MEKILIYSHTGLTSKQIGLTTEIIEGLVSRDFEVKVVLCDNVLHNCYFNRTHNVLACASCQSRQRALLKQAGIKTKNIISLKQLEKSNNTSIRFKDTEALMNYDYQGIDIGRGVASSIISYFRELEIDTDKHQFLIDIEINKAKNVLTNIKAIYNDWKFDKLYIFNGRFAETWPVIRYAEQQGIPYHTMEAGAHNRYELFENALPHSMKARQKKIEQYWTHADHIEREKTGNEWFTNRRGGIDKYEKSFIKNQVSAQLPIGFDPSKRNIVIFNSSEDEMASISEYQNDQYKNQNEAIQQIMDIFRADDQFHFYLRMHPNLAGLDNTQTREIYALDHTNLTIIRPEEKIDSYAMMDACEKVLTFGSSTGIEATYWKRPSILYGKAFYMYLDCVYHPQSPSELKALIIDKDLSPKHRSTTIPFGYFMMTFGIQTSHFNFVDLDHSTYKGKRIKKLYLSTLKYLVKYSPKLRLWKKLHKAYFGTSMKLSDMFSYK